jgi:hypothetical protein
VDVPISPNSVIPTGTDHRKAMICGVEGPCVVTSPGCEEKDCMVLLHGFMKKTQKTPEHEIDLALKRKMGTES